MWSGLVWLYILVILIALTVDWFALGGYTGIAFPAIVALAGMLPIILQQRQFMYGLVLVFS